MRTKTRRTTLPILALLLALGLLLGGCGQTAGAPAAENAETAPEAAELETAPMPTPTPAPTPEPAPEPTPEPEAESVSFTVSKGANALRLLRDGNERTAAAFASAEELRVSFEEPVSGIYLLWNSWPAEWTLLVGEWELRCGRDGYLHEYVPLPDPATEVRIRMPEQERTELSELYAFTAGALPDWVQVWTPPCETADLLVISTHSDDEYIFFGGLIPTYAGELGLEVQVAYMVDHFEWQKYRWHELLNGLWTGGVTHYPVTGGFHDGLFDTPGEAVFYYKEERVLEWETALLRRFRPLVVATHAENGEYRNGAHMLVSSCAKQAAELAADPEQFPESAAEWGVWDTPKLYLHLYGDAPAVLDYEHPIERFGGRTAFEVAQEAYRKHVSQQPVGYKVYGAESPGYDSHVWGLYRSLVGEDEAKNDLFERVEREDWRS